ncbi:MAG: hypothetical protein LBQ77_02275 [Treponema sp.]|jgi:hypothetical protein|nr:hypothetical protein [Treponema sp.]
MKKNIWLLLVKCLILVPCFGQNVRSFDSIFPRLSREHRQTVFSPTGLVSSVHRSEGIQFLSRSELDKTLADPILSRNPTVLVELLMIIPTDAKFIDVYNAVGQIKTLKDPDYHSPTLDHTPLFEEASRVESPFRLIDVPDPPPATTVPRQETFFFRLQDENFGNSYFRADINANSRRFLYTLSNIRSMNFYFVPIIAESGLIMQLYFEPVREGMLAYCIAGAHIADFIVDRVDIPTAIRLRVEAVMQWVVTGIIVGRF